MNSELKEYIANEILKAKAETIVWVKSKVRTVREDAANHLHHAHKYDYNNHVKALAEGYYAEIVSGEIERFGFDAVAKRYEVTSDV